MRSSCPLRCFEFLDEIRDEGSHGHSLVLQTVGLGFRIQRRGSLPSPRLGTVFTQVAWRSENAVDRPLSSLCSKHLLKKRPPYGGQRGGPVATEISSPSTLSHPLPPLLHVKGSTLSTDNMDTRTSVPSSRRKTFSANPLVSLRLLLYFLKIGSSCC